VKDNEMKVYCVGWEYEYGGGFDWFLTSVEADKAFENEKSTADHFATANWIICRFDVDVSDAEHAVAEIDQQFPELFDAATIRYRKSA